MAIVQGFAVRKSNCIYTGRRRTEGEGVAVVDSWLKIRNSQKNSRRPSSAQFSVHALRWTCLSHNIRGARPILMLAVKHSVTLPVGPQPYFVEICDLVGYGGSAGTRTVKRKMRRSEDLAG